MMETEPRCTIRSSSGSPATNHATSLLLRPSLALASPPRLNSIASCSTSAAARSPRLVCCCVCVLRFFTEVQSHVPEFDCLKSCDISPRISALEWWPFSSSHLTLLAANDRSVKVWRIESKQSQVDRQERQKRRASLRARAMQHSERRRRQADDATSDSAEAEVSSLWSRAASVCDDSIDDFPPVSSHCCAVFRGGHHYSIHSVSSCADGATFLSADDLRVLLFDIDHSDTACSVLELPAAATPAATVDELLTVARFHPRHAALFLHGSSSGTVRIADTRLRLNCTCDTAGTQRSADHSLASLTYYAQVARCADCCCQGTAARSTRSPLPARPSLCLPPPSHRCRPPCPRCFLFRRTFEV